ncbi:MAG: hypothetical protein NC935_01345 [Candidatus Omnitrophica bacterium]|nr:hypothetical protein [Candidatus Omnitrophota bacterium]
MFNKNKKAFSLIEILLATVVLVVALGSIVIGFIACFILNESSRNLTIATTHAQYVLEEIKDSAMAREDIKSQINNGNWDWEEETDFTTRGINRLNNETIDTEAEGGGLVNVTVTVYWKNRGRDTNITFYTQMFE